MERTLSEHISELSRRAGRAELKSRESVSLSKELSSELSLLKIEASDLRKDLHLSRISQEQALTQARELETILTGLESTLEHSVMLSDQQVSKTLYWRSRFRTAEKRLDRRTNALWVVGGIAALATGTAFVAFRSRSSR